MLKMRKFLPALLAVTVLAGASFGAYKDYESGSHFLPAPVMVVGAYTPAGNANFGTFHRGGVLGNGNTLYIGFGVKNVNTSFTMESIRASGSCSINLPSVKNMAAADLLGSFSGRPVEDGKPMVTDNPEGFQDKLAAAGLTVTDFTSGDVKVPLINEFPVSMVCEFVKVLKVDPSDKNTNGLVIVKVVKTLADEDYVDEDGTFSPVNKAGDADSSLLYFSHGTNGYYGFGERLGEYGEIDISKFTSAQ